MASEFEQHLEKEIAKARRERDIKNSRKDKRAQNNTNQMRDSAGFKIRVAEANSNGNKMVDPEYHVTIDGALRRIDPYEFEYKTFCKERWRDRKVVDIFTEEFRDREPGYYRKTIASGAVFVNGEAANLDTILRNGQQLTHKIHRHEPPVSSKPIKTVFEDENILVIDKPSGIPVHPTGRYRYNTITKILEKEMGISVHPCNRLDRLTSGLMFLAKTPKGADQMGDQMKVREVSKEYIARVVGEFPIEEITVEKPLKSYDPKVSLNTIGDNADENSKPAKTVFKRISYDGQTSIVKCKPLTGRTHQIRVHLQYLGHPIANDPIYSNVAIWGPEFKASDYDRITQQLDNIGKTECAESWFYPKSEGEMIASERCDVCDSPMYTDPGPNDLDLWLHAYKYESTECNSEGKKLWSYRTAFPDWALEVHRKYMEMAIDEADKCGPTQTAFSVGAVIVNGTEILSTGYSRELPGNTHAEQCALEKYFERTGSNEVPAGSVIYTTMEPCSFRLSGNLPCLERILAQQGNIGTVFVGVMEPDTFVKNNTSLTALENNGIDYILIPGYEDRCNEIAFKGHEKE
ncbi:tRNA pseudouridine(32) synthase, mitochondrial [Nakaseomyces bracarensis]|uniref:tRNA pseudouridine(32) synthase, mitochondrial n=1 Tax=Nakaseomyces bracarensis TaxID=273131 RepID=A0ABR4NQ73_9SACH